MRPFHTLTIGLLANAIALHGIAVAQEGQGGSAGSDLREVIVSHTDENGLLQLYRMKEDGSASTQLTHSRRGCRMPACSPNGRKVVYIERTDRGLSLRLSDLEGRNVKALVDDGMNLVPSWLPDSKDIVWMIAQPGEDPSRNSQIHVMNTETGQSRRLFSNSEQLKFSNSMPVVSPRGDRIAFVSNRSGNMRIWVSDLDGSNAKLVSPPEVDYHETIKAPIEQKVPAWSPDGKWIAHWEGVEMVHMSKFTGVPNRERDRMISATFHVWVVGSDGKNRRKAGRGDDPTWSPDGFVTRAFPDPQRGGPKIMIETESGEEELPIVPRNRNWGRFAWLPQQAKHTLSEQRGGGQAANPFLPAADPHAVLLDGVAYLYPTCGHPRKFYAFSSRDLATWRNHGPILDFSQIDWIPQRKAAWAPALAEKDGKHYFYYSVGPKPSHLGVAVANSPIGPFTDSGRPLLSDNGKSSFEAIDPMVFKDPATDKYYLYAGGSAGATLRVFELAPNMTEFAKEITVQTPPKFTEGAFMHYREGTYYLSYSHGGWRDSSYSVHYASAEGPLGPWEYRGAILVSDETRKGPGHHSFVHDEPTGQAYIFYHRWDNVFGHGPYRGSRGTAIDLLHYGSDGHIKPIIMTDQGVGPLRLKTDTPPNVSPT